MEAQHEELLRQRYVLAITNARSKQLDAEDRGERLHAAANDYY